MPVPDNETEYQPRSFNNLTFFPNVRNPNINMPDPLNGVLMLAVYGLTGEPEPDDYFYDILDHSYAYMDDHGNVFRLARYDQGEPNIIGFTYMTYDDWRHLTTRNEFHDCPTFASFLARLEDNAQRRAEMEARQVQQWQESEEYQTIVRENQNRHQEDRDQYIALENERRRQEQAERERMLREEIANIQGLQNAWLVTDALLADLHTGIYDHHTRRHIEFVPAEEQDNIIVSNPLYSSSDMDDIPPLEDIHVPMEI